MIVGPRRSGKSTIARVLARLVGTDNVVAPTLASLGSNFGLQPLIGKSLAIISDARLGARADQAAIVERLLAISGEDPVTIDRKHMLAWTGRLPTRFVILTNELPRLTDASGALASRMIVLLLTESFFGREDHGLADRLFGELPGILNTARQGLLRLRKRGHFIQPESAQEAIAELESLGSPVGAFVREQCNVGPAFEIETELLFTSWLNWCQANGRKKHGTVQTFGRDLRATLPSVKIVRPREGDDRHRKYVGIDLKQ
jgi:putative DNA primase/helicase